MISKIVEQQLKKCYFANLNNFDENTNTYFIPKYSKPKYDLNNCYLIKVNKEVINTQIIYLPRIGILVEHRHKNIIKHILVKQWEAIFIAIA